MLCNYHFLQHLAPALHHRLLGKNLLACYSQDRDELAMEFGTDAPDFYIKAVLKSQFTCLAFPTSMSRAKKNTVTIFEDALGATVEAVEVVANDRSFTMRLSDGFTLLFKMHGNRSNVLLFRDGAQVGYFNHHLKKDSALTLEGIDKHPDQSREAWMRQPDLRLAFPTLGKEATAKLETLGWSTAPPEQQWEMLQHIIADMQKPKFYIEAIDGPPSITFFPATAQTLATNDPLEACNLLYRQYNQVYLVDTKKAGLKKAIQQKIHAANSYIEKSFEKMEELMLKRPYSQLGDLLMANLHQIDKSATSVVLDDFFTSQKTTIKIPAGLSPQKAAENYYRKSKNQAKEQETVMANIDSKKEDLLRLGQLLAELELLNDAKSVRKFEEKHHPGHSGQQNDKPLPYHLHEYMGYTIYVGKNAKANDELLHAHSSKNDLWLHARDTAGSHVIIKERPPQQFPEPVIEFAAKLAAAHSKAKHDTLCPVIYTPRKYVRKAKNLAPGQVIVEKEKVVLVEPGVSQ